MSFFDVLFGRTKPAKPQPDAIFAMATAQVTLGERMGLKPGKRAGVCFRPVDSSWFRDVEQRLDGILAISERETSTKVETREDGYGYRWVVLEDEDLEDLVTTVYLISRELKDQGFGEQLLAAVFRWEGRSEGRRRVVYWVYNFKRGKFYPFVPAGSGKQRDNARELQLQALLGKELPIEPEPERWYALWDVPV